MRTATIRWKGDLLTINSRGNIVGANGRTVALIDVDDLIVIDTEDALLISKKGSIQQVKQIVAKLQADRRKRSALRDRQAQTKSWAKE